jgi:hypothetical protein
MNANWNRGQLKMYHPYNGSVNILLHQEIYKKMSTIVKMVLITCLGLIVSVLTSSYSSHQFIFFSPVHILLTSSYSYQPIMRILKIVRGRKSERQYVIYYI